MTEKSLNNKRSKEAQSQITEARKKMKEKVVESKKKYMRKSKHPNDDED